MEALTPIINKDKLKYFLGFSQILRFNAVGFKKVFDHFTDIATAWQATSEQLKKAGISERLAMEITIARNKVNLDQELENLEQAEVSVAYISDSNYPSALKEIYDPPPLLYYRGSLDYLKNTCLAVVGTRKFSLYGRQITEELVSELAKNNITIVSGLALGIDAIAHKACLDAGGQTIGILGSGVNAKCVFPSTNRYIADKIISSGGAIISEYPIGTMPNKFTFPRRNRIVSGMSFGVLIIEAPENSGTLITAKHALEQNRDIFAIPGNIDNNNSQGTNGLIKRGAKLITSANDIIEELNPQLTFKEID